jgi:hypothetical protein
MYKALTKKTAVTITVLCLSALVPTLCACNEAPVDSSAPTASLTQAVWPKQGTRPSGILGLPMPVTLTLEEKSLILLIAQGSWYQVQVVSFQWYAIIWSDTAAVATVWAVDEQAALTGIPTYINPNALWYPGITVTYTEGGITYKKQVAVDYDSYRVVYSEGPYIPPGTPQPSK